MVGKDGFPNRPGDIISVVEAAGKVLKWTWMEDWLVILVVLFSSSSSVIIARCGEYKEKTIYQEIYILLSVESVSIKYHIWPYTLFLEQ